MIEKVKHTIEENGLIKSGMTVTVALSGGADSMSLLTVLRELQNEIGFALKAAHLNHLIRGEEAYRDENFVKEVCRKFNIPLVTERIDVPKKAKAAGESLELAARNARYDFFERINEGVIATAHNADDNLETFIMNSIRGTGLKGLCSIPVKRGIYIRPLLNVTRCEIEQFCKDNNIDYVTDSTNSDDDCTRNIIRHSVTPVLRSLNSAVAENIRRTAENNSRDEKFLEKITDEAEKECIIDGKLIVQKVLPLDEAIKYRVVGRFLKYLGVDFSFRNIDAVLSLLNEKAKKTVVEKGIVLKNFYGKIAVQDGENQAFSVEILEKTYEFFKKNQKINNLLLKNAIDCDKIVGNIKVRTRKEGDKITLSHRGVTKSLKKLFIEDKIPENKRNNIPVVADNSGVVWVYGYGVDKRVLPDDATKNIFYINCSEIEAEENLWQ